MELSGALKFSYISFSLPPVSSSSPSWTSSSLKALKQTRKYTGISCIHHLEVGVAGNSGSMLFLTTVSSVCSCMDSISLYYNKSMCYLMYPFLGSIKVGTFSLSWQCAPLMKLICCTRLWCHVTMEAFKLCFFGSKLWSFSSWFNIVSDCLVVRLVRGDTSQTGMNLDVVEVWQSVVGVWFKLQRRGPKPQTWWTKGYLLLFFFHYAQGQYINYKYFVCRLIL